MLQDSAPGEKAEPFLEWLDAQWGVGAGSRGAGGAKGIVFSNHLEQSCLRGETPVKSPRTGRKCYFHSPWPSP